MRERFQRYPSDRAVAQQDDQQRTTVQQRRRPREIEGETRILFLVPRATVVVAVVVVL